jgi:Ion channel
MVTINERTLRQAIMGRDSYVVLFVLLLIDYTDLTLIDSRQWSGLVRVVPIAVTALFALRTSAARRHVIRIAQGAIVLSVTCGIGEAVTKDELLRGATHLLLGFLLIITPIVILRRILQHDKVHVETLFGAIDVYIILGLIFAMLFVGLATLLPSPPHTAFLAETGYHPTSEYVYLSFITLTTVGFGDVTPLSDLARSIVVLEAVMGQIFLVTLVARLVALYGLERPLQERAQRSSHEDSEGAASRWDEAPPT